MADDPPWKLFERAVAQFVAALDANAIVRHDVRMPDIDTGEPRQRDVWVEAKVCNHFPLKLLISCKHTSAPLDSQDMDAFVGERRSSGADKGVMYSLSGYTEPALRKAEKLNITCCRLYQGEPPDIPNVLRFRSYCCTPRIQLSLDRLLDSSSPIRAYKDLFGLEVEEENGQRSNVLDMINKLYHEGEREVVSQVVHERRFPPPWSRGFRIDFANPIAQPLTVVVRGAWNIWRGRPEAHLVAGSYAFDSKEFLGSESTPFVDTRGPHPGPGWELIEEQPEVLESFTAMFILYGGDTRDLLSETLGEGHRKRRITPSIKRMASAPTYAQHVGGAADKAACLMG